MMVFVMMGEEVLHKGYNVSPLLINIILYGMRWIGAGYVWV